MIIIDLDDTIFKTSSMDPRIFDSAIEVLIDFYKSIDEVNTNQIVKELWQNPIDVVFQKYSTPDEITREFYLKISEINYRSLEIKPFEDYSYIGDIKMDKILVTTGLTELQNAKIDALGIRKDFNKIFIDDPRRKPRTNKFQIFNKIIDSEKLDPKQIWVIGDNPESEIMAAAKLGINTV